MPQWVVWWSCVRCDDTWWWWAAGGLHGKVVGLAASPIDAGRHGLRSRAWSIAPGPPALPPSPPWQPKAKPLPRSCEFGGCWNKSRHLIIMYALYPGYLQHPVQVPRQQPLIARESSRATTDECKVRIGFKNKNNKTSWSARIRSRRRRRMKPRLKPRPRARGRQRQRMKREMVIKKQRQPVV